MSKSYCEAFQKPIDPYTGEPYPGAPLIAHVPTMQPGGFALATIEDGAPSPPPPPSPAPRRPR